MYCVYANLRAEVYTIITTDRATIKKIAGKIIPAISTTTAFVTGAIAVELYKLTAGLKAIENYRSCFVNLSMPMICFSEPGACRRYQYEEGTGLAGTNCCLRRRREVRLRICQIGWRRSTTWI